MDQGGSYGDDSIPVEMTVSVGRGNVEEIKQREFVGFDEVVIPVEIVLEMTPALRMALERG